MESTALPADAVEVGRVSGAYGIQGWIKVQPYAGDPQALFSSKRWFLDAPVAPAGALARPTRPKVAATLPAYPLLARIVQAREQGDSIVAAIQELSDRNGAEALRGARVFVPRSSFPSADEGEFYWVDLIGLAVHNRTGEALGTVVGLIETGPHSVLRVQPASEGAEILIPFVDAYVDRVDHGARVITVDWGADY